MRAGSKPQTDGEDTDDPTVTETTAMDQQHVHSGEKTYKYTQPALKIPGAAAVIRDHSDAEYHVTSSDFEGDRYGDTRSEEIIFSDTEARTKFPKNTSFQTPGENKQGYDVTGRFEMLPHVNSKGSVDESSKESPFRTASDDSFIINCCQEENIREFDTPSERSLEKYQPPEETGQHPNYLPANQVTIGPMMYSSQVTSRQMAYSPQVPRGPLAYSPQVTKKPLVNSPQLMEGPSCDFGEFLTPSDQSLMSSQQSSEQSESINSHFDSFKTLTYTDQSLNHNLQEQFMARVALERNRAPVKRAPLGHSDNRTAGQFLTREQLARSRGLENSKLMNNNGFGTLPNVLMQNRRKENSDKSGCEIPEYSTPSNGSLVQSGDVQPDCKKEERVCW